MSTTRTIPVEPAGASIVTFTVKVGGEAIPRTFSITSAVITRQVNRIARLNLQLLDGSAAASDFPASNSDYFVPGKELEFWGGYNTTEELLFRGIVVQHSLHIREAGSPQLRLLVQDKAVRLCTRHSSRYFEDKKDSDIIEDIAGEYGLDTDVQSTNLTRKQLVQYGATDWDFILTRAELNGLLCFTDNGKLVVQAPVIEPDGALELLYGATVLELDAEMDARHQFEKVDTAAWNEEDQALTQVSDTSPSLTEQGNLNAGDLAGALQQPSLRLLHGGSLEETELQTWADARMLKSRYSKIRGKVRFRGLPTVLPGKTIKLDGLGARFNGLALATGVRHEFFGGSWTTDVQFGLSPQPFAGEADIQPLPAAGLTPGVKGLQIGLVTDLADPQGSFRVKVKIPAVDMQGEGSWCRMLMPDAGSDRGFFFRPEVGDEVIIGFLHEDPNQGVVLGGLYSSAKAAPLSQTAANDEKGIVTRSGMRWVWNDAQKTLTVETPAGKKLVMDDTAGELKLEDETGNKLLFDRQGITIQSAMAITIAAGTSLAIGGNTSTAINGGAECKVSASGSAEFSSGGTVKIQGAFVQIN